MSRDDLIETLAQTPRVFEEVLDAIERGRSDGGEWWPADVFAHVLSSDAIIRPRVFQLLVRPGTPLPGFDERAWMVVAARAAVPAPVRLRAFAAEREELVGLLRTLTSEEWTIEGVHEERGAVTLEAVVKHMATHEAEHHGQIREAARAR